ncbi:MAG: DNA polymerase III subunit alpha [Bacilli bacterium]|nr:DNA polymerase III subunit alpha [Bacilli bacterium]
MSKINEMSKYVNLYTETEYSMLSSPNKLTSLIDRAVDFGYEAIAITDSNMYGAFKFYCLCKEKGIKPIIGIDVTISLENNFYSTLLLYAKNYQGYLSLLKIATEVKINKDGLSLNKLKTMTDNCIIVIPSDENEIVKLYREGNYEESQKAIKRYQEYFVDVYLGIDLQTYEMKNIAQELINFATDLGLPSVAINKTSYLENDDFEVYKVLKCIGLSLNNYPYSEKEMNQSFISPVQANDLFRKYPKLIEKTIEIANKCQLEIKLGEYKMPVFFGNIKDTDSYLKELAMIGLNKRLKGQASDFEKYRERLLYELDIIIKMGFSDYFLIVYDFVKYAKKSNILVGPGRGSAPGSLVSYSLGITNIDPLKYDLLFERFLNPERISMPDIDMDFPDNRRDEVISYVGEKYGRDKVAHISTFGTFGVRLAIRDIARVMKISELYLEEILKYTGNGFDSMETIINNNPLFKQMIRENEQVAKLISLATKLEGLPRHVSTHAAGVVIGDADLVNYTPLQEGINGLSQTQYEASDLEKIGLVKIDFLGIRNLTIIDDVIAKIGGGININEIPLDDHPTYEMIANGDTDGLFQLESGGMKKTLMMLKTSEFNDIVNAIALFRPGPKDMIPTFVKRKFGEEKVEYLHKDLQRDLESTYGIIVFQEQIILIAQHFAGYTPGQADILRRAISKKNSSILIAERDRFIKSAVKKGHSEELSNEVYDYIVKFANYGFNKSHSVSYSLVAYQMGYLKCHYYKYFMAVLMSNTIGSIRLIKTYINNCNRRNIKVFLPSVNRSRDDFVVCEEGIYYSLLGIQNLGALTLKSFLEERDKNGMYQDYDEFIRRTKDIFNKRIVESMIYAGALDEFKIPRKQMVMEYDTSLELSNYGAILKDKLNKHVFSDEEYSFEEISRLEKEYLGMNLKYDIFRKYLSAKAKYKTIDIVELEVGQKQRILFAINRIKVIKTKKNDNMAFLEIYDETESIDAVLFPRNYQENADKMDYGVVYVGEGKTDVRDGKKQLILENIFIVK